MNSRIDTLQAAILLAKFEVFEAEVAFRQKIGERYSQRLKAAGIAVTPIAPEIVVFMLSIRLRWRIVPPFKRHLGSVVSQRLCTTTLMCQQPALHRCGSRCSGACATPFAQRASEHVISLPMHPYLSAKDQDQVVAAVSVALR